MPAKGRFSCPHPALRATFSLREKGHAERSTRENLLLRPWLLCPAAHTARALDRAERNGAERGDGICAPSQGDRNLSVRRDQRRDRAGARPRQGRGDCGLHPAAQWGGGGAWAASPPSSCTRRRAAPRRLLFDHRGLRGPQWGLGSTRRARARARTARGLARLEDEGPRWSASGAGAGRRGRSILRLAGIYGPGLPQYADQSAPSRGAADRQAGAGVQPRPCRRHRRDFPASC